MRIPSRDELSQAVLAFDQIAVVRCPEIGAARCSDVGEVHLQGAWYISLRYEPGDGQIVTVRTSQKRIRAQVTSGPHWPDSEMWSDLQYEITRMGPPTAELAVNKESIPISLESHGEFWRALGQYEHIWITITCSGFALSEFELETITASDAGEMLAGTPM